jgi:hypothetical protein
MPFITAVTAIGLDIAHLVPLILQKKFDLRAFQFELSDLSVANKLIVDGNVLKFLRKFKHLLTSQLLVRLSFVELGYDSRLDLFNGLLKNLPELIILQY